MTPRTLPLVTPPASVVAPFPSSALTAPPAVAGRTLARVGRRLWSALERLGQQRAAAELARTATLIEHSRPATARLLRAEAAAGRAR
jgi:hypothetical protein